MKRQKLFALTLALLLCVGLLTVPAGAYDMGKVGGVNFISAGGNHTAAIDGDGSLWIWGDNSSGQLGNGSHGNEEEPFVYQAIPIKVLDNVVTTSCGGRHTAAIDGDGSLWMWGNNGCEQLGHGYGADSEDANGMYTHQTVPIKVMDDVTAVSCGFDHTAAIQMDSSLWAWGASLYGRRQSDNGFFESLPVKMMDNVAAVSCGFRHAAAIQYDGSLWMWGWNDSGQLGNGTKEDSATPIKVLDDVIEVCCGWQYTAAIRNDHSLWMWGLNDKGQLGNDSTETSKVPVKVMDNVTAVSCGGSHTAAIDMDRALWMWGNNRSGQLGNGGGGNSETEYHITIQTTPIKVLDNVIAVSCGDEYTVAVKADGTLWTWGQNESGQLGNEDVVDENGDPFHQTVPRQVEGIKAVGVAVAPKEEEQDNEEPDEPAAPDESSPAEDEEASTSRREEKESGEFPILPVLAGVCSVICVGAIATAVILIVKKRK